jgi:hypothetical protein
MGVMTVAPTAGVFTPPFEAAPRFGVRCASCGTTADSREPFCAHCGSRVAIAPASGKRPAALAATRSLQFALLAVGVNIVLGGLAFGVVYLVADAARLTEAALGLEVMRFLVVAALAALAIRFGIRGLRETRDGQLRRRGWAIAGIVLASCFGLLVTLSLAATALLYALQA